MYLVNQIEREGVEEYFDDLKDAERRAVERCTGNGNDYVMAVWNLEKRKLVSIVWKSEIFRK